MDYSKKNSDARHPNTITTNRLTELAEDENCYVREYVARNPSTPVETLAYLARDEDCYVREAVAGNPSTPPATLAYLAECGDKLVREMVTQNSSTPLEVLTKLTCDTEKNVRTAATKNPVFLHHRAVQDGVCEAGQQMPVEWLRQMYSTSESE